jgi:VanZ family protein
MRRVTEAAVEAFAVGLAFECIQPLTGRHSDLLDMAANAVGALLGAALVLAVCRLRRRRRS